MLKKNTTAVEKTYSLIRNVLEKARDHAYREVNFAMVQAYWNVGRIIVEGEQKGKSRAEYGRAVLQQLSRQLSDEFGRGFDERNLLNMRSFYTKFPIPNALRTELSWTHYRLLLGVATEDSRTWYMNEAANQHWSTRQLDRQIGTLYYERLIASRSKKSVRQEAAKKLAAIKPEDLIHDPYVLEFLNLRDYPSLRESKLEQALIDNLQHFLLELGKGFSFVARQKRVRFENDDFYVDLVFYNYILKCFVLIDLKTGKLTHQDIGQMDSYVRVFEKHCKTASDNPTIGLILCAEKNETMARYSVLSENKRLFASKYIKYLPTEDELKVEIEKEALMLAMNQEKLSKTTARGLSAKKRLSSKSTATKATRPKTTRTKNSKKK